MKHRLTLLGDCYLIKVKHCLLPLELFNFTFKVKYVCSQFEEMKHTRSNSKTLFLFLKYLPDLQLFKP